LLPDYFKGHFVAFLSPYIYSINFKLHVGNMQRPLNRVGVAIPRLFLGLIASAADPAECRVCAAQALAENITFGARE
jgi:hypothetical protein